VQILIGQGELRMSSKDQRLHWTGWIAAIFQETKKRRKVWISYMSIIIYDASFRRHLLTAVGVRNDRIILSAMATADVLTSSRQHC